MSDTITLADLDTAVVFEAAMDGSTGASGRHQPTPRYALYNRVYKQLRSIVSQHGDEFFRTPGTSAAIPARASGEDWIELTWPTDADEIVGVDVQISSEWQSLTKGSWAQRRVFPGANRLESPGEWATLSQPQPSTTTVSAGKIVIWPHTLSGNYKIDTVPKWTAITTTTHVFMLFPDWLEYLITGSAMVLIGRDNNKAGTYATMEARNMRAEAKIIAHARRSKRGSVVARRRDGQEL